MLNRNHFLPQTIAWKEGRGRFWRVRHPGKAATSPSRYQSADERAYAVSRSNLERQQQLAYSDFQEKMLDEPKRRTKAASVSRYSWTSSTGTAPTVAASALRISPTDQRPSTRFSAS